MADSNNKEFVVKRLSKSETLDEVHGKPSPRRVNKATRELLAQMGGQEAAETTRKLGAQIDAEKRLARLDKRSLAKEVTLPETAEAQPAGIEAFLNELEPEFVGALSAEVREKSGVDLKDFPAAVLEPFLALIAKSSQEFSALEAQHEAGVYEVTFDQAGAAKAA